MLNKKDQKEIRASAALLALIWSNHTCTRCTVELVPVADRKQSEITARILARNPHTSETEINLFFADAYEEYTRFFITRRVA